MKQLSKTIVNVSRAEYSHLPEIKRNSEAKLVKHLKSLNPTFLLVQDTTLGANSCGSMYKIIIESPAFLEKTKVEQHKLVAKAIESELPNIHGFSLKTRVPAKLLSEMEEKEEQKKIEGLQ